MFVKADYFYEDIYSVDFFRLKKEGIKLIIFDLDSTVMVSKSGKYTKEMLEIFNKINIDFELCVMSNNTNREYIEKVQKISPFVVYGNVKKPFPEKIGNFIKEKKYKKEEVIIIGDRPLTDILAGNLLGIKSVLVGSINKNEPILTKFIRKIEGLCLRV